MPVNPTGALENLLDPVVLTVKGVVNSVAGTLGNVGNDLQNIDSKVRQSERKFLDSIAT